MGRLFWMQWDSSLVICNTSQGRMCRVTKGNKKIKSKMKILEEQQQYCKQVSKKITENGCEGYGHVMRRKY